MTSWYKVKDQYFGKYPVLKFRTEIDDLFRKSSSTNTDLVNEVYEFCWLTEPCSLVVFYLRFGDDCCFHHQEIFRLTNSLYAQNEYERSNSKFSTLKLESIECTAKKFGAKNLHQTVSGCFNFLPYQANITSILYEAELKYYISFLKNNLSYSAFIDKVKRNCCSQETVTVVWFVFTINRNTIVTGISISYQNK